MHRTPGRVVHGAPQALIIRFFRAMPDDGVHQDGAPHGGAIAVTLKAEYESLVQFGDDVQRLAYQQCKMVRLL